MIKALNLASGTMSTKQLLDQLAQQLRSGDLTREEQVKQFIIEPLLLELGWNLHRLGEVEREFNLQGDGRVDYALSDDSKPLVFIEAKQLGKALLQGEGQLFRYANNRGIPLLVLTDGDAWHLYLAMASGKPEDRLFYSTVLSSDNTEETADSLRKFLGRDTVTSESARREAEETLERRKKQEKARDEIPRVWRDLIRNRDELLIELVQAEVKEKIGSLPSETDVSEFLDSVLSQLPHNTISRRKSTQRQQLSSQTTRKSSRSQTKIVGFRLFGQTTPAKNGIDAYRQVICTLHERDPNFISQFAKRGKGKKRVWIARTQLELFPEDPVRARKSSFDLGIGWWSGENISIAEIQKRTKVACEVAGLAFGKDFDFEILED